MEFRHEHSPNLEAEVVSWASDWFQVISIPSERRLPVSQDWSSHVTGAAAAGRGPLGSFSSSGPKQLLELTFSLHQFSKDLLSFSS